MIIYWDYLNASIIGGMVLMMLVTVHHHNTRVMVEETVQYQQEKHVIEFIETLKKDVQSADSVDYALVLDGNGRVQDGTLRFWARVGAETSRSEIEYEATPDTDDPSLVYVSRTDDGGPSARHPLTFDQWNVTLLSAGGQPVSAVPDAKQIRIHFRTQVRGMGDDYTRHLPPIEWQADLYPPSLN